MKKTLLGLGLAVALTLTGCTPSGNDAPSSPSTTTSRSSIDNDVASVDLADSTQPGALNMARGDSDTAAMTADGSDGRVARMDDGMPDQGDVNQNRDVASRADNNSSTSMGVATKALEGNLAEQRLSALALERSQSAEVRKAAEMIQNDHQKAETQLRNVDGSDLPSEVELNAEHKKVLSKLEGLDGSEFDKAYINAMVTEHEKALAFYKAQAKEAPSEQLKGYFAGNTQVIQQHLDHCRKLQESMS